MGATTLFVAAVIFSLQLVAPSSASSSVSNSLSCSAPPSSIEVCLSSIFNSMEYYLKVVEYSMSKYEKTIHSHMHREHSLIYTEVSWVYSVNHIGKAVKKAVRVEKQAMQYEVSELTYEYNILYHLYAEFYSEIEKLEEAISNNVIQINNLKQEYNYIKTAKWELYGYISAIIYEKSAVNIAINEVQKVVKTLNIQVQKIYSKISELKKRQTWLLNWENKLYVDLEAFSKDITKFKNIQTGLVVREQALYKEQTRLKQEAINVRNAIKQLKTEYNYINEYLNYLMIYEKEVISVYNSVYHDATSFISAYGEFTCEDNLLYYEACSSAPAAKPAAAGKGKAVVPPKVAN